MSTILQSLRAPGNISSARGFTLVELMIVLVIVAVLLVIAVPSYAVLSLRTKLKSYANELVASVYLARGEAIKRDAPMTLCVANSSGSDCAGGGDWDQGWIVKDQDDVVIEYRQSLPSGMKIFELSGLHTVTFQSSGILSDPPIMTICQASPSEGIEEREVRISTTGRHMVKAVDQGDPDFTNCSP